MAMNERASNPPDKRDCRVLLRFILIAYFGLTACLFDACQPKLDSSDPSERFQALQSVTNQTMLAKVALVDKDPDVRRTAVEKLTDPSVLARVVLNDTDTGIREAAVWRITDQAVALQDTQLDIREAAVWRLTNRTALAKVAAEAKDVAISNAVVRKLK